MIPTIPGFKIVYACMQPNLVVTNTFHRVYVLNKVCRQAYTALGEFKLTYLVLLSLIISTILVDGMHCLECVLVLL